MRIIGKYANVNRLVVVIVFFLSSFFLNMIIYSMPRKTYKTCNQYKCADVREGAVS